MNDLNWKEVSKARRGICKNCKVYEPVQNRNIGLCRLWLMYVKPEDTCNVYEGRMESSISLKNFFVSKEAGI